ncbi:hypothetical protein [Dysgonomonas sp. 521]|uniref:hypothetical protein n=1 Tax=Dysgonomonas sp. 521 TaxID=2302932 RepID=UPI0013D43540|nr:hypothetical protein [Dysgonomonas sp. 521]
MKAIELIYKEMYKIKGQPDRIVSYTGREGNRYWFTDINGTFWMNEKQIETLIISV